MKIAVSYDNGQIFQHFGHTAEFKFYTVEDGKVTGSQVVPTPSSGHGALTGFLRAQQVDALICGGIGGGARAALDDAGIRLYGGVSGEADRAVEALLAGNLDYNSMTVCGHHAGHVHAHREECGRHEGHVHAHREGCGRHEGHVHAHHERCDHHEGHAHAHHEECGRHEGHVHEHH